MLLVTGGPDVKLFHSNSNLTLAYLPSFGRYFSSRLSWRMMVPAVTVFVVVSCVPIPILTMVCAPAEVVQPCKAAASATAASFQPKFLLMMAPLRCSRTRVFCSPQHLEAGKSSGNCRLNARVD